MFQPPQNLIPNGNDAITTATNMENNTQPNGVRTATFNVKAGLAQMLKVHY
jgi:hypothetical protein